MCVDAYGGLFKKHIHFHSQQQFDLCITFRQHLRVYVFTYVYLYCITKYTHAVLQP